MGDNNALVFIEKTLCWYTVSPVCDESKEQIVRVLIYVVNVCICVYQWFTQRQLLCA